MYTKAIDLKEFYDGLQGRVVQRLLRPHLRRFWGDVTGQRVLGYGYATPYLKPLTAGAERVIALMPQQQGAIYWPADEQGLVSLCDEAELPIETSSIDRMLVIHGLQSVESLDAVLREAWRVLTGQGSLLLVVPNRTGAWARFDHTPFGHGTPYSMGQIRGLLKDYMFIPERAERALFVPPSSSRLMLSAAPVWEKIGSRFFNAFGGVNIIEAGKQLYAGTPLPVSGAARVRRSIVMGGAPAPRVDASRQQRREDV
jgi:SAM-dependent methyltransferase